MNLIKLESNIPGIQDKQLNENIFTQKKKKN